MQAHLFYRLIHLPRGELDAQRRRYNLKRPSTYQRRAGVGARHPMLLGPGRDVGFGESLAPKTRDRPRGQ